MTKTPLEMLKGLKPNKELDNLLAKAKDHKMTSQEDDEQTIAIVVAECNHVSDVGASPETVRAARLIKEASRTASKKVA